MSHAWPKAKSKPVHARKVFVRVHATRRREGVKAPAIPHVVHSRPVRTAPTGKAPAGPSLSIPLLHAPHARVTAAQGQT